MKSEYSFCLIKYRHDSVADETLNVAVALYCPKEGRVGFLHSPKYSRLSEAFSGFDGDFYKKLMGRLGTALEAASQPLRDSLFALTERDEITDIGVLLRRIWPDQGLNYFCGPTAFGLAADLEVELKSLFDRFILSQYDSRDSHARFSDEELWGSMKKLLTERGVERHLMPKVLGSAEIEFEHAWKNDRWHVIEPLSLDYASPVDIKNKALLAYGKASAMKGTEDFGSLTLLVERPRRVQEESRHYQAALKLLKEIPVNSSLYFREEADKLADKVAEDILRHEKELTEARAS